MKKIIVCIFLFLIIFYLSKEEYNVSEDTIRYRVIANSNNTMDIIMKEKVVSELSGILFQENQSLEQVNSTIYNNIENIERRINKLFKENNYNKSFNISYGINSFPEKTFMGKKYSSGDYKSLVIEIGEGKGNNYFCSLYPSLCIIDYNKNKNYGFRIEEVIKKLF